MKRITLSLFMILLIVGCAQPQGWTEEGMTPYDKDTDYAVQSTDEGFLITVNYTRYQYIPESTSVAAACKQQLTALAWNYADSQKREIEPVNEQRITLSMGRNGLSGITSCRASAPVKWKTGKGR